MMPATYTDLHGHQVTFDLDAVVDVVDGWSGLRSGWRAFIAYDPQGDRFIELQSTAPTVRGDSADEAIEVSQAYVEDTFGLTEAQLLQLRRAPHHWTFLPRRK